MTSTPDTFFEFTCLAATPVQAEGTVAGHSFYFRARGDSWKFTVAEREGDEPVELDEAEVAPGLAWIRSGTVPGEFAASWMPLEDARSIINECARAFMQEKANQ